jgi:hypothetical protein
VISCVTHPPYLDSPAIGRFLSDLQPSQIVAALLHPSQTSFWWLTWTCGPVLRGNPSMPVPLAYPSICNHTCSSPASCKPFPHRLAPPLMLALRPAVCSIARHRHFSAAVIAHKSSPSNHITVLPPCSFVAKSLNHRHHIRHCGALFAQAQPVVS